ncbi:uncharacterized protein LOC101846682 [Aplysia californica]|uniref:Uncharacterized protein LOC101846682 n=1 Tax=Aplysia californica TaxID=6500 RepID=A0ABM1VZ87_APLCA|nr:uncharacterized protein LOC101846682 [Aplysia californica]XP_035827731.1 uncharacterized protein LOC101846682 [Aplysia californica]
MGSTVKLPDPEMMSIAYLEDGKYVNGDSGEPHTIPDAFDKDKFHRGRRFFKDNLYSCTMGMFFSLIIGMSIPEFLEALIFTGESDTPKKAIRRYVMTYNHVLKWHYGNVWEENSAAKNSILFVRSMHEKVRSKMHLGLGTKHKKFLSQYDMGVVLSGFMGCIIMYPRFGGIVCSRSDLDDYVYFWYVIGRLLGIEDKYNICANGLEQAFKFCKEIEQEVVYNCLQAPPSKYKEMTSAVLNGVTNGKSLTLLTYPVISAISIELMGQKYSDSLSFPDLIRYAIWKVLFFSIRHCSWFRYLLNLIIERSHGLTFVDP